MFWRRVSASAHNCALIIVVGLPLLPILGKDNWRVALIAICFGYHWVFRRHCLGNHLAGVRNARPLGVLYCAVYTAGFSTILWSVFVPFDLLFVYVAAQAACLRLCGQTIPGYLTGYRPA